ncbi:MAG: hypothetical protein COA66_03305 [Arcobacter sp.]|nr:MAG: hypothetical protein COA66_03305 [Arcobacter sp.]
MQNQPKLKTFIYIAILYLMYEIFKFFYSGYIAEKEINQVEYIKVIKKYDNKLYQNLLQSSKDLNRNVITEETYRLELQYKMNDTFSLVQNEVESYISNEGLLEYYTFVLQEQKNLSKVDCYEALYHDNEEYNKTIRLKYGTLLLKEYYTRDKKYKLISKSEFSKRILIYFDDSFTKLLKKKKLTLSEKEEMCTNNLSLSDTLLKNNETDLLRYFLFHNNRKLQP